MSDAALEGTSLFVPGRIELLGKHTDYAGGASLTCATEQGLHGRVRAAADATLVLEDRSRGERWELALPRPAAPPEGHWARYAWTLLRRWGPWLGTSPPGVRLAWTNELPLAAGLSTSTSLLTLVHLALEVVLGTPAELEPPLARVRFLAAVEGGRPFGRRAEAEGVGTRGGAQDHAAILASPPGAIGWWSYDPLELRGVLPFPAGHALVVASSGVEARKLGNAAEAYGRAARLAAQAASSWRAATGGGEPHLGAILEHADGAALRRALRRRATGIGAAGEGRAVARRVAHFAREHGVLVPRARAALAAGDLEAFGHVADRSQRAAERWLGNQVPETVFLQRRARALGARAASAFGAGFGGAVWALVPAAEAASFAVRWRGAYVAVHPRHASACRVFASRPGVPARVGPAPGS